MLFPFVRVSWEERGSSVKAIPLSRWLLPSEIRGFSSGGKMSSFKVYKPLTTAAKPVEITYTITHKSQELVLDLFSGKECLGQLVLSKAQARTLGEVIAMGGF